MTTNELLLAKAFRDAGFPQDKAEAVAQTIFDAIRDNVATKSDVQLSAAALRSEIQAVRSDLRQEIQAVQSALAQLETRLTLRMGAITAAGVAVLTAIKFFG